MPEQRIPIFVPIMALVVGAMFLLVAALRPAALWDMGKVRAGREWVGDTGVVVFFVVIGLLLVAAGVAALLRR